MTKTACAAVDGSLRVALMLGHNYINTEHLLLSLISEEEGTASLILGRLGVDRSAVLGVLRDMMQEAAPVYEISDYRTDCSMGQ